MMKKKWILMSAFAVIAILYTALSFIFVTERTGLFWAGLSFFWQLRYFRARLPFRSIQREAPPFG